MTEQWRKLLPRKRNKYPLGRAVVDGVLAGALVFTGAKGAGWCNDIYYPDTGSHAWRMGAECGNWDTFYLNLDTSGIGRARDGSYNENPETQIVSEDHALRLVSGGGGENYLGGRNPWRFNVFIGQNQQRPRVELFVKVNTPFGEIRIDQVWEQSSDLLIDREGSWE